MNSLKLSILVVCLIGTQALSLPSFVQPKFDSTLANYLVQSNSMNYAVDPALSQQCFAIYLPILSEVASTFSTQYQACNTVANQKIVNLTAAADASKAGFIQETSDICTAYQSCNNETDVLSFFDCYSSTSTKEVSVLYALANNASTAANTFSEGLEMIQNEQALCTNTTEHTYVDNTAATYQQLDACLQNGPPTTVSTTDAPTTVSTTDEPTTTTTEFIPTAPIASTVNSADNGSDDSSVTSSSGSQSQSQCVGPDCVVSTST